MRLPQQVCLLSMGLLLGLSVGCGTTPTNTPDEIPYPSFLESSPSTEATQSSTPESMEVGESTSSTTVTPHQFTKYIASDVLRAPKTLAALEDYVLVCDQNHKDPIGTFAIGIRFGRDGNRQGTGCYSLTNYSTVTLPPNRLPQANAICTDGSVIYMADNQGIYAFDAKSEVYRNNHSEGARVFNSGNPYVRQTKIRDMVMTSTNLYALIDNAIVTYSLPSFQVKKWQPATGNGLGLTKDGKVVLAMEDKVVTIDGETQSAFTGFSALKDVTVDQETGDVYALTAKEVLRLDAEGKIAARFGTFYNATSIAIDKVGVVYVSDPGNNTVMQFSPQQ